MKVQLPASSRLPGVRQLQRVIAAKDDKLAEQKREIRRMRSVMYKESATVQPKNKIKTVPTSSKVTLPPTKAKVTVIDTVTVPNGNQAAMPQGAVKHTAEQIDQTEHETVIQLEEDNAAANEKDASEADKVVKEIINDLFDMVTADKVEEAIPTPKREATKMLEELKCTPTVARLRTLLPVIMSLDTVKKAPDGLKKKLF